MATKEDDRRPGVENPPDRPTVEAEDEASRARRQAEGPAPGAPRSADDRAVEKVNEWKEEVGEDQGVRSPPGGTQR